jgi:membrane protein
MGQLSRSINVRAAGSFVLSALRGAREDRISVAGASAAFFIVLATFPGIAASVSIYGFFANPSDLLTALSSISSAVPDEAVQFIRSQLKRVSSEGGTRHYSILSAATALLLLLWSANKGTTGMIDALNVVYDEAERRSFARYYLLSFLFTMLAIVIFLLAMASMLLLPRILEGLGWSDGSYLLLRWPALLAIITGTLAILYRWGPTRTETRWTSIMLASCVAALLWVAASALFSSFVNAFGSLTELYGSLTAIIAFMLWVWASATIVLFGAEIDVASGTAMPNSSN